MGIIYSKGSVKDDIKMLVSLDTIFMGNIDEESETVIYKSWKPKSILKNDFLVVGLNFENISKACDIPLLKISNHKDIKWRRQFYFRLLVISDILLGLGICFFDSKLRIDSERVKPLKDLVLYFPKNLFDNKKRVAYFQEYWKEYDELVSETPSFDTFSHMERKLLRQRIMMIIDKFFRQFKDPRVAFVNIIDYMVGSYLLELKNPIEKMTNLTLNYELLKPTIDSKKFIKSDNFAGKKEGYVFKKDSLGLGYYLDTKNIKAENSKKQLEKENPENKNSKKKLEKDKSKQKDKFLDKQISSLSKKIVETINNKGVRGKITEKIKNLIFDRIINISKYFKKEINMDRCRLKYLSNDFILFSPAFDSRNFSIIRKKTSKEISRKIFKEIREGNRLGRNLPKKGKINNKKYSCNTCASKN